MSVVSIFAAMLDLSKNWNADDVRRLCEVHELSQHKLAALLDLRVMTINNWITGKVQPSRIASIALTYIAHDLTGELTLKKKR
jgi:DNA-binding transcriptional regulator YiaG